jgi:hypothetical protein
MKVMKFYRIRELGFQEVTSFSELRWLRLLKEFYTFTGASSWHREPTTCSKMNFKSIVQRNKK